MEQAAAILRHRILEPHEETELARRIERGRLADRALREHPELDSAVRADLRRQSRLGRQAADDLALHNMRLANSIAMAFRRSCGPALEFEDLLNEAYIGLAKAVEKFDWRKGFKFSTYATWWIRQSIQRAIAHKQRSVRLPADLTEDIRRVHAARQVLSDKSDTCISALARCTGLSEARVRKAIDVGRRIDSLDRPVGDDGAPLGALIAGDEHTLPEALTMQSELSAIVNHTLDQLSARERDVVQRRFGLSGHDRQTFAQIGEAHQVTGEAARRMVGRVIAKLDSPDVRHRFGGYIAPSRTDRAVTAGSYP